VATPPPPPQPLLIRGLRRIAIAPRRLFTHYWLRPRSGYVVSYPKSGRTWLAIMLATVLARLSGRPLSLDVHRYADARRGIPRIFFTHDGSGLTKPRPFSEDKEFYRHKPVLLLVRDPRDVVVSHYYQVSRRKRRGPIVADLDSFVRGPLGIDRVIAFMNAWAAHRTVPGRFAILRYEELHADRTAGLRRCAEFFAIPGMTEPVLAEGVAAGSFERMQAMEAGRLLGDPRLQPRDAADPDSFKVRRGRMGGFKDELTAAQIGYLDERIRAHLDPFFGYEHA
jgi:hypothetical protein